MKKKIVMILAISMMLSLAACGDRKNTRVSAPASVSASIDKTESSVKEPAAEPAASTETDYIGDFKKAQHAWFLFEDGMELDYNDRKTGEINGYESEFYRVNEPGISTLAGLKALLSEYVTESLAEETVNNAENYKEFDGVLYACPAGRGDDLTIGWVEFEGSPDKVIVKIHRCDYYDDLQDWYDTGVVDTYEFPFTVVDGHARFTTMEYLCGSAPVETPDPEHDKAALEAALKKLGQ